MRHRGGERGLPLPPGLRVELRALLAVTATKDLRCINHGQRRRRRHQSQFICDEAEAAAGRSAQRGLRAPRGMQCLGVHVKLA